MKKVAFATGSRADYGIMREYLRLLNNDENIDLSILVTGALLDDKYGNQVSYIYKLIHNLILYLYQSNLSDS